MTPILLDMTRSEGAELYAWLRRIESEHRSAAIDNPMLDKDSRREMNAVADHARAMGDRLDALLTPAG